VKRISIALAMVVVAALAVAGCGGGSDSGSENAGNTSAGYGAEGGGGYGSGPKEASTESPEKTGAAVVSLGQAGDLGMVLVASNGHTLYDFEKDKGGTPACYGTCTQAWAPLTTGGEPQAGNGASSGMLGTVERKNGTTQVTYAGHPLYTFIEDQKPGEANGNDLSEFGGEWYALMGNGEEPED